MTKLHTVIQSIKISDLPVGISETWRYREGRSPYFEYQVCWKSTNGKKKVTHFYVGINPNAHSKGEALRRAIRFRQQYELRMGNS